ncbi:discoidin domain-containing protein [Leptospira langatensis]|uniref:Discoidin domain-containing protein n=1 Tax=Leptospira langatensis TaxID=2484983 RepID=A0A5F1ZS58_9LEPT|nr:discoidin domain-containing protein [Leptospira langatensis]TGK01737.1 discoidin domain-containing protein [Leptospira langatensis]TGL39345.1 discoidin domain-containing protein [Leptospira langatensis]
MNEESIRISHPRQVKVNEIKTKGTFELKEGGLRSYSEQLDHAGVGVLTLILNPGSSFNQIKLHQSDSQSAFFPDSFKFEISLDGKVWEPILQETGFRRLNKRVGQWNFSLVRANFLKLVSKVSEKEGSKFKVAIGALEVGISGVTKLEVSSEKDRLLVKENLIDERPDYGWSSLESAQPKEEFFLMDLGSISRVNELRLLSPKDSHLSFPETFTVYYSEDDLTWNQLLEENQFLSEPGVWYQWRFLPANIRFLKFVSRPLKVQGKEKYGTSIAEVELYAAPYLSDLTHKPTAEPLPYATVLRSGLVRLAVDGETSEGAAVQANDRRLRDGSTEYKGIVELASDGEEKEGVVVQGNDKRLKHSTETSYGLVRLASNGENRADRVVQGNDDRLKPSSTQSMGIVELAENGETKEGTVVQGNDDRLKHATTQKFGLVQLAGPGEKTPGKVVTSDDPRLRHASTESPGILRFASNGEESAEAAVQGNDKRLKLSTPQSYGIVKLALSGENKEGSVVQGNDERLRHASTEYPGIVSLAPKGKSIANHAVTSDDPRLSDAREPKPHTHEYAPKEHDFSSHTGFLRLKGSVEAPYSNISPPPENSGLIYARNESEKGSGVVGSGRFAGILAFGERFGARGDSASGEKDSAGILGLAKRGFGGWFHSRSGHAVYASGKGIPLLNETGSGKAILAEGDSDFIGTVYVQTGKGTDCIAKFFPVQSSDVIAEGDLLAMGEDGKLHKSRQPNATNIVGVAVKSAALVLGEKAQDSGQWLVAIAGVALANVEAQSYPVQPGDLLCSGLTGGHAVRVAPENLKPGSLVAKSLGLQRNGRGLVPVLLSHS